MAYGVLPALPLEKEINTNFEKIKMNPQFALKFSSYYTVLQAGRIASSATFITTVALS